jgi:hypothetical protein
MTKKPLLAVGPIGTLLELLDEQTRRRRAALQDGQAASCEARRANRARRVWEKSVRVRRGPNGRCYRVPKFAGGLTYAGADHNRKLALPGWQVIAARMIPGDWYGVPDLYELAPEYAAKTVRFYMVKLWKAGITERARNADYQEHVAPGAQSEPQWLYRLSARGEKESEPWCAVLEAEAGA